MSYEKTLSALKERGFDDVASQLEALKQRTIELTVADELPADSQRPPSKLGGDPDLPAGFEWPRWDGVYEEEYSSSPHLSFLVQLNLADVAGLDAGRPLPESGVLSFFYHPQQTWGFDPRDRGSWQVFHFPADAAFERRSQPDDLTGLQEPFDERFLTFELGWSVPGILTSEVEELLVDGKRADEFYDVMGDLVEDDDESRHRLFGHADAVQESDMALESQLASHGLSTGEGLFPGEDEPRGCLGGLIARLTGSGKPKAEDDPEAARRKELAAGANEWILLLQLDSDETTGMMWGDLGRLFFWIRESALRERRFDECWMILQCT